MKGSTLMDRVSEYFDVSLNIFTDFEHLDSNVQIHNFVSGLELASSERPLHICSNPAPNFLDALSLKPLF